MSKELNIIEASNMPNTEFEVYYPNGEKRDQNVFTDKNGDIHNKKENNFIEGASGILINAKFIPIPKQISFMELVNDTQGRKIYVEFNTEHSNIFIPQESDYFSMYLFNIINNNDDYSVRKIIFEGKWFIEY